MNPAAPAVGAAPPVAAGSARHLAWLYAPETVRTGIAALLTLDAEIASSTRAGLDHAVAHARLGWWEEEVGELARGRPRHPVGRQLADAFAAVELSPPDLRGLVEVARLDLACAAFESQPELADYLARWSEGLFRNLLLLSCPAPDARADVERLATAAGSAVRDIELVARLASDARLGRVRVALPPPAGAQGAHEPWQAQPWPPAQALQVKERLRGRRQGLLRAAAALPASRRPALRAALVWCTLAARLADRCAAALPLQYDAGRFDAPAAAWIGWRAALAASRGRLPGALQENR
jgi:phytoene synthase